MDEKQLSLLDNHEQADNGPVVCLGMTFKNDEERREYFRNELRKKLPELKKIEGFPIGDDEDIIALSDPPYYTACPNPWINDFYKMRLQSKAVNKLHDKIIEPYTNDVKEGKNDAIYNAHSYHTKVPYKAIIRYLLHYTEPGDIVFDGFSGSGMTGVACKLSGDAEILNEMGYVIKNNEVYEKKSDNELVKISDLGKRCAILSELSPAATFIASVYNDSISGHRLEKLEKKLFEFARQYSFLYYTLHTYSKDFVDKLVSIVNEASNFTELVDFISKEKTRFGKVNYVVYSDVYVCPSCTTEVSYWELMVDRRTKKVRQKMICQKCNAEINKKELEKVWVTFFDKYTNQTITLAKQIPVLINYTFDKKRFEKELDKFDYCLLRKIENLNIVNWFPTDELPDGYNLDQPKRSHGFKYVHNFYHSRTLFLISEFLAQHTKIDLSLTQFLVGSILPKLTKMNRYMPQHGSRALVGPMANVLYLPPMHVENNVIDQMAFQFNKIKKALNNENGNIITTQSSTNVDLPDSSVDYIFIDPPFGANIMYSDLNFIRESWLKVKTNNKEEAIENSHQNKDIEKYKHLITLCLKEAYRILKPGKWITVEFSNTKASVWNAIQSAIQEAGFVIASVDALDKTRGGLYSMITTIGVKQDLIISAYKPIINIAERSLPDKNDTITSVWEFVKNHLNFLPVTKGNGREMSFIAERDPRIIYDRVVAYFVRNGLSIPISAAEFQEELVKYFPIRDGMVFLENQIAEYDKKRTLVKEFAQMSLFVTDETSAIEWLRQQLLKKPQTRQDLHPNFMKEIQHIAKHEKLPELDDLLHQNFLKYEGDGPVPDQIASYLRKNYKDLRGLENDAAQLKEKAMNRWYVPDPNKQADLEKLREKALLREFEGYLEELEKSKKKLKQFRTEAIRAGFKKAWSEKDYEKIVKVGDRLPESVIQEDDKLLMYYDNAQIRLGL
ncbi:DNA methyltransferase [Anoxybacteroides rupiense]|uniref:DNA methyltransferase n=1 Tax=Anoxybacteroides rupiense TaxID=311460 RepID=UPI003FA52E95